MINRMILQNKGKAGRKKGSEQRLWTLTYSQIAVWVGLTVPTVRSYSHRGQFDHRSIESVLQFVNARRQRFGLPLIGLPDQPVQQPDQPEPEPDTITHTPIYIPSSYDPQTGAYN